MRPSHLPCRHEQCVYPHNTQICASFCGRHPHLQQDSARPQETFGVSVLVARTKQIVCQIKQMFFCSTIFGIFGTHYQCRGRVDWPYQNHSSAAMAQTHDSNPTERLPRTYRVLQEVHPTVWGDFPAFNWSAKKELAFVWSPQVHDASMSLKQALVYAPILALPNFQKEFVLEADACATARTSPSFHQQDAWP
jgi:hypothetical protein